MKQTGTTTYNYHKPESDYFEWHGLHVARGTWRSDLRLHTHDFYEASIIIAGSAKHVIGGYEYHLKRGDVYVVKKGVPHGFVEVNDLDLIDLMYFPDLFALADAQLFRLLVPLFIVEPDIRERNYYPYVLTLTDNDLNFITTTADFMIQELKTRENTIVIRHFMLSLFAYLSAKYGNRNNEPHSTQILSKAVGFMYENMAAQIKIADIADHLFMSTRHLGRLFMKYYGTTPGDYLTDIRLKHALSLIERKQMKVGDISALCGFTDPSYFARLFKKAYGITPHKAML
ncbi:MAG: AraC family transcriptional regulator [Defluviitaleaceae bacterium]|nr:AraC family transcriptional regulator [Defluviitaleaceae bacterium]